MSELREEISDLLSDDGEDRFSCPIEARKKAMDCLARRDFGQTELIRKLVAKGYARDIVEQSVSKLTDEGLQSDRRFAEAFVQSRVNQGKGPVRIRLDLGQRGLTDGAIDNAIEQVPVDWFELAREVRLRKFGGEIPTGFKEKARQMRFLQYRGFEQDHVQAAFLGE